MCNNAKRCLEKSKAWLLGAIHLDLAHSLHLKSIRDGCDFIISSHAKRRQFERAIADRDIVAIIKNGTVVHSRKVGAFTRNVLLGYLPLTYRGQRPLHLVLEYQPDEKVVVVVTLYDPRLKGLWNEDFTKKICFCEQD